MASAICASVLALAGCVRELEPLFESHEFVGSSISLVAEVEQHAGVITKTALGAENVVTWLDGDAISVFTSESGENARFATSLEAPATSASFSGTATGTPQFAFYPYDEDNTIDGSTISFSMPKTQSYKASSFADGANVAVGEISGNSFTAKNVFGVLKLKLKGTTTIAKIEVTSKKSGEKLWGDFTVDASADSPVALHKDDDSGSGTIALNCGKGVTLDPSTVTEFLFVVPVGSLSEGFTVNIITDGVDNNKDFGTDSNATISRSNITPMAPYTVVTTPKSIKPTVDNTNTDEEGD